MKKFINKLKLGVAYDSLDRDLMMIVLDMQEKGIVFERTVRGEKVFKFCNNVTVSENGKNYLFTISPNRHIGVFFEEEELFDCVSRNKQAPEVYCLVYALNPSEGQVREFGVGNNVRVKVEARGYNDNNEGLLLRLPGSEEYFYKMSNAPCLTIGLAKGAKGKNTSLLNFDEKVKNKFLEGRKGIFINGKVYYDLRKVKDTSLVYTLVVENYEYRLKKVGEKELFNR